MRSIPGVSAQPQRRASGLGWPLAVAGGAGMVLAPFLPWAYSSVALDNMTVLGYPSPLQFLGLALGVVLLLLLAGPRLQFARRLRRSPSWTRGAKAAGTASGVYVLLVAVSIALELGGLVNVRYGGWLAVLAAGLAFAGTRLMLADRPSTLAAATLAAPVEISVIAATMLAAFLAAAYALNIDDGGSFLVFIGFLGGLIAILLRTGVMAWMSAITQRHRRVLILSAFIVAFLFPFTQGGSDANMSIATQVLIFAATAMGLNIVVGLAGLLDLGYIAFLGAGAFVAAVLSRSAFATADVHPPFIVVVLISGLVAATLGLIIGSPTLRVSGDYLAIVTLAFGEIFRISMNNLDGTDGPLITRGSNGIPAIPDLEPFGFDFGEPHTLLGVELGRFSNYYFLLLLVIGLIILVFARLNHSRIGRGWVAIREDEKAAEAMGVNVFGLKLFAFAGGAFLAGVAGAVKAHQDVSVTPDQYVFLESAFLLAAIVLGGMGTVLGVLIGATLLKLMPEKLRFVNEYRLLIFGLLLVLMMRFRPEGLVANRRRQLEFHEEDEELADRINEQIAETGSVREAT
ncbi:MAG TPA: branched-chain amino acid ABC transporter permease [Propionibacteriaceae bacterium]|nr:branched-chain amino acid ABC transporter permease [Propionibacteriaceae bacterium]